MSEDRITYEYDGLARHIDAKRQSSRRDHNFDDGSSEEQLDPLGSSVSSSNASLHLRDLHLLYIGGSFRRDGYPGHRAKSVDEFGLDRSLPAAIANRPIHLCEIFVMSAKLNSARGSSG